MNFSGRLAALLAAIFLITGPVGLHGAETGNLPEVNHNIEKLLKTGNLVIDGTKILTRGILLDVYEGQDFSPIWTRPERIRELIALIESSPDHGLSPADYNIDLLRQILRQRESSPSAEIEAEDDILLAESLLRYGYHRRFGKMEGSKLEPDINFRGKTFNKQTPDMTIEQAIKTSSLADFIEMIAPTGPAYQDLQSTLKLYRNIAASGGWPAVPKGATLHPGDEDSRVVILRNRLAISGDLAMASNIDSPVFDEELERAVKAFQERHALEDDGIIGKQSFIAMNIPVEHRIDQLRISLERLRWVNQEAAQTFVAVNIAGFRAFFYKNGQLEWTTRAMVGKYYRQTPIFRGDIAYLEFNPTWTIPPGILRNDTLPAIKRDPNYLASKNIRVIDQNGKFVDPSTVDWNLYTKGVPYTLRQEPGPNNALGMVKFIFPNKHFVFLHDTPHPELFSHAERAFSSGCIRIQDPLKLAELIMDDPAKYNRSELEAIVASKKTQRIYPSPKMPVVIVYLTASVEPGGKVRFYKDIYQRDQKVLDALNGPVITALPNRCNDPLDHCNRPSRSY